MNTTASESNPESNGSSNATRVGLILIAAAVLAIVLDNSPLAWLYDDLLDTPFSIRLGSLGLEKPLLLWINDGLMAVFFLLVGIEIKRVRIEGQFQQVRKAILPLFAALGGMVVPALFYSAFNHANSDALRGWAIPCATDIAFALGVLSLAGSKIPTSIRSFLTAVAVIDDLGSIVIIAAFYTASLSFPALVIAGVCCAALAIMNRAGVTRIGAYLLIGIVLWVAVLKSGVHATLAGVVLALAIPLRAKDAHGESPAIALEHQLKPWVDYFILPVFAFANAGLPLLHLDARAALDTIPLGITTGLVIGKPIGIAGSTWLANRLGIASPPDGATWKHVLGAGLLGGIGFTMSLFIGSLAFDSPLLLEEVRLGVLCASLLAGILGYGMLKRA